MADRLGVNRDLSFGLGKELGGRSSTDNREREEVSGLRAADWACRVRNQILRSASDRQLQVPEMLFESYCHQDSQSLETCADEIIFAVLMYQILESSIGELLLTMPG